MKKLNAEPENIANTVGVAAHSDPQTNKTTKFDCRGGRLCPPANKQSGITLIALIITIIVMLILVGVTINVALNGGLFEKAKKASYQTEASTIKEQLEVAKAIKIADNGGIIPADYGITINNLDIPENLKTEYENKLIIDNGILYYNSEIVTNVKEQEWLEEIGINGYEFSEELNLLKLYVLGSNKQGRNVQEILDMATYTFKDDSNSISDASSTVTFLFGAYNENSTKQIRIYKIYGKRI